MKTDNELFFFSQGTFGIVKQVSFPFVYDKYS